MLDSSHPPSEQGRSPAAGNGGEERGLPKRPVAAAFLVLVVDVVGFGIIIPLLPFYAEEFGASPFTIGLLFASFAIAQFAGVPILGYLSDRWGRRPILLLSLVGSVVAFILLGVAQGLLLLFAARIIDGATGGNISTVRTTIADVTSERDHARGFGIIGTAFGVGFVVGPALGGFLSQYGFRVPAFAAAGLALVAFAITWFLLPETRPENATPQDWPWKEAKRLVGRGDVATYLGTDFVWWSAFAAYQTTFPLFVAERLGFGATGTGLLLAYLGAINAVVQFALVGPVSSRLGEHATLTLGLALGGLGLAGAALSPTLPFVIASLTPAAFGIGLSLPSLESLLSRTVRPQEQGRLQGVSGGLESLGRAAGPLWGNGLIGLAGAGIAYGSVDVALFGLSLWSRRLPDPSPNQILVTPEVRQRSAPHLRGRDRRLARARFPCACYSESHRQARGHAAGRLPWRTRRTAD